MKKHIQFRAPYLYNNNLVEDTFDVAFNGSDVPANLLRTPTKIANRKSQI